MKVFRIQLSCSALVAITIATLLSSPTTGTSAAPVSSSTTEMSAAPTSAFFTQCIPGDNPLLAAGQLSATFGLVLIRELCLTAKEEIAKGDPRPKR